jgi:hypothetical protein
METGADVLSSSPSQDSGSLADVDADASIDASEDENIDETVAESGSDNEAAGDGSACQGKSIGSFCGTTLNADPTRLYVCGSGSVLGSVVCQDGCLPAPGDGGPIALSLPPLPASCAGTDPCVSNVLPPGQTGDYCGLSLSPSAVQNDLYACNGRSTVGQWRCPDGCWPGGPGNGGCGAP